MSGPIIADWVQAIASVLMFGTAAIALIIAAKAPRWAAEFAEQLRRESSANEVRDRLQLHVFLTLMAHRSELGHPLSREAINSVDVVFAGSADVRNARRLFMEAVTQNPNDPTIIVERFHSLIEAVARAVGISESITPTDIRLGYYPEVAARLDLAAIAEAEEKLARRTSGALDAYKTRKD